MKGGHVEQLETTRLFGEIFFLLKRWSLLERRKMGYKLVEPLRILKKNVQFTVALKGHDYLTRCPHDEIHNEIIATIIFR